MTVYVYVVLEFADIDSSFVAIYATLTAAQTACEKAALGRQGPLGDWEQRNTADGLRMWKAYIKGMINDGYEVYEEVVRYG